MRKLWIFALALTATYPVFAQKTSGDTTQALDDVIIKETYEAGFQEDKLSLPVDIDFSRIVQIPELIHWTGLDSKEEPPANHAWQPFSMALSAPEQARIQPVPVKTFQTRFKNLSKWSLEVLASDGTVFKRFSGTKNPDSNTAWNGIGDDGTALVPGRNYSYRFTATDKAGNKRVFPGQTFSVAAYYMAQPQSLSIGLAMSKILSQDGLRMLTDAGDYAREIASLIRYYHSKGEISVSAGHGKSGEFVRMIAGELRMDPGQIRISSPDPDHQDYLVLQVR